MNTLSKILLVSVLSTMGYFTWSLFISANISFLDHYILTLFTLEMCFAYPVLNKNGAIYNYIFCGLIFFHTSFHMWVLISSFDLGIIDPMLYCFFVFVLASMLLFIFIIIEGLNLPFIANKARNRSAFFMLYYLIAIPLVYYSGLNGNMYALVLNYFSIILCLQIVLMLINSLYAEDKRLSEWGTMCLCLMILFFSALYKDSIKTVQIIALNVLSIAFIVLFVFNQIAGWKSSINDNRRKA